MPWLTQGCHRFGSWDGVPRRSGNKSPVTWANQHVPQRHHLPSHLACHLACVQDAGSRVQERAQDLKQDVKAGAHDLKEGAKDVAADAKEGASGAYDSVKENAKVGGGSELGPVPGVSKMHRGGAGAVRVAHARNPDDQMVNLLHLSVQHHGMVTGNMPNAALPSIIPPPSSVPGLCPPLHEHPAGAGRGHLLRPGLHRGDHQGHRDRHCQRGG
jgi:hypothetical protein